MEREQGSPDRILNTLRFRPRGMTITEIAKATRITRNSVAKYLEVLRMGGQVDMHEVGNAKVYSLAQRVPLSAFLCFTRDLIVVLDEYGTVLQANDRLLGLAALEKADVIGKNVRETALPIISAEETLSLIEGVKCEQCVKDIRYPHRNSELFFRMQVFPTVFADGGQGHTVVLEDTTDKQRCLRNMAFLAETAMEFVDLPEETDIYTRIAGMIREFVPYGRVFIQSYDDKTNQFVIRAVEDQAFRDTLATIIGRDPVGMVFPLGEVLHSPFLDDPAAIERGIRKITLGSTSGDGSLSFYDLAFHSIPADICDRIVSSMNLKTVYVAFLVWKGSLLGDVGIFVSEDEDVGDLRALESLIRQASIAISRRMTEERLRRSNERFREVVEHFPFPAAILDAKGCFTFINHAFTRMFGYTVTDIRTEREWMELAFPDPVLRSTVIAGWRTDCREAKVNQVRTRRLPVHCKDGDMRSILIRAMTLCDATQFLTFEDITELRRAHSVLLADIANLMHASDDLRLQSKALFALGAPVAITNGGEIKYANPAFLMRWGYSSVAELAERPVEDFWTKGDEDSNEMYPAAEVSDEAAVLTAHRRNGSTFYVVAIPAPVRNTDGVMMGTVLLFQDMATVPEEHDTGSNPLQL